MTARPCPLCDGDDRGESFPYGTWWNGRLFRNLACGRCGASFVDPVPEQAELVALYSRDLYHDAHYDVGRQESQTTMLHRVRLHLPGTGTLLDFGCGNGHFLRLAAQAGFAPTGVELDPETCRMAAQNSGCTVLTAAQFEDSDTRFDVIHLGDVLEHLPDPADVLRGLERHLATDGRFFLEGPLEDNPSAVNGAARLFGRAKRLAGRRYGSYLPLHLFRADAAAQRRFFTRRMDHVVHVYTLGDDGWPYAVRGESLLRPGGAVKFVKLAIARASQASSAVGRALGLPLGNRFAAVTSPKAA